MKPLNRHGPLSPVLLGALLAVTGVAAAAAYAVVHDLWPDGAITMHLQLGPSGVLLDGAESWGQSAESALSDWNQHLRRVEFRVVRDSTLPKGDGNGVNNVFFADDIYGMSFGPRTLAVTTNWFRRDTRTEADVVFNAKADRWDSYSGGLRPGTSEFRRVALHEFGHVLGLEHPDEYGQSVSSIMNSRVSSLDRLTSDDIEGAQALYSDGSAGGGLSGAPGTVAFPPRDESLNFRSQLDAKYRDGLRRSPLGTYVDIEGDVVWTQEYLRYRVNQCAHQQAVDRVMNQIDGRGDLGVCGAAPSGQVPFPPRNESLVFRNLLEAKYRDGLGRSLTLTNVDHEGDVVWTQEYLRYRVNGCGHGVSVESVMTQIDGRAAPPVCR